MARSEERISTPTAETKKGAEHVTVLGAGGAVPEVTLPDPRQQSNEVRGSVVPNADAFEERKPAEPPIYGIVIANKLVHCNRSNGRVLMRAGKVLSSKEFDLAYLARQGLQMRKHEPEAAMPEGEIFVS